MNVKQKRRFQAFFPISTEKRLFTFLEYKNDELGIILRFIMNYMEKVLLNVVS